MDSRLYLRAAPLVLLLVVAIFAPLIVAILGLPHPGTVDFHALGPLSLPVGPSSAHPFGVDNLGRDVLARVLFGARTALGEVLVATALAGAVAFSLRAATGNRYGAPVIRYLLGLLDALPAVVIGLLLWVTGMRPSVLLVGVVLLLDGLPAAVAGIRHRDLVSARAALELIARNLAITTSLAFFALGGSAVSWGGMTADAIVTIREGINAWWWLLAPMIAMTLSIASFRWLAAGLPAPAPTDNRTSVTGALALGVGVLAVCWLALGATPAFGAAFAHLSATVSLVLVAGVLCFAAALVIAALPPLRLRGRSGRVVAAKWRVLSSAPVGAVAGLLLWLFSSDVGRFPLLPGAGSYAGLRAATGSWFSSLVLPWLALSFVIASFASGRPDRRMDLAARAAGLHRSRIVGRRIRLRAVDLLVLSPRRLSAIVSVALVAEVVFEIPGLGSFARDSIAAGHPPAVAGAAAVTALSTAVVLFVLALARLLVDPRERR